ncbi:MAG: hypothetical protein JO237_07805 [Pseudolabrys sp.]|nr:hypothetical protein [Pseudolabrys sp.]
MGRLLNPADLSDTIPVDPSEMAARLMQFSPASDAEALKILRASFPDAPLSLRVAALAFLSRKSYPGHAAHLVRSH